jgi:hypothetical protein
MHPALTLQHCVKTLLQRMKMQNVARSVCFLRVRQCRGPPVRRLLLLRQINFEEFAADIFQPVPVGVGSRQPRGNFRAVDRRALDIQPITKRCDIEPGKMKQLQNLRIAEKCLQIGRITSLSRDLNQMAITITRRKLHQA